MSHHAALLLLADGRLPAGAYAHSSGLEPAVNAGQVRDLAGVTGFLRGRLETVGRVAATFAAAACRATHAGDGDRLDALDAGLDARYPSAAARATSRQLGRQMARTAAVMRPDPRYAGLGREPHQPLALGLAFAVFDLSPRDAALAVLHESAVGVAGAAVRLLSLDPVAAHAVVASLTGRLDELGDEAEAACGSPVVDLPADGAPLLDVYAEQHGARRARLFAS